MPFVYLSTQPHKLPIVIDTGASSSVTPNIDDFIQPPTKTNTLTMEGLNGQKTEVLGSGMVRWKIEDQNGIIGDVETSAYYVPSANICLFSRIGISPSHNKSNSYGINSWDIST